MCGNLKYEKANIELRRGEVIKLLSKGHSQSEIAKELNVSNALISLDIQYLKEKAKEGLRTHIQDRLPFEFARATTGINDILRRAYDILDKTTDPKLQHQWMTLIMQLWGTVMSLATDGGVIEQAFRKVEGLSPAANIAATKEEEPKEKEDFQEDEEPEPIEPEEEIEKEG
jgi:predicted transcriptional regulator